EDAGRHTAAPRCTCPTNSTPPDSRGSDTRPSLISSEQAPPHTRRQVMLPLSDIRHDDRHISGSHSRIVTSFNLSASHPPTLANPFPHRLSPSSAARPHRADLSSARFGLEYAAPSRPCRLAR